MAKIKFCRLNFFAYLCIVVGKENNYKVSLTFNFSVMGKNFNKWGEKEFREYLNGEGNTQAYQFLQNLKRGNIVAVVKHIAKSGMSCKVRFYTMEINEIDDISGFIARAGGFKMSKDHYGFDADIILNGCGFNVIYACLEHVYNHIKDYTDLTDKSFNEVYKGCALL